MLLHLPEARLAGVFQKLARWLEGKGVLYVSFKQGKGERMADGRRFVDMTETTLRTLIQEHTPLDIFEIWISGDVEERGIRWVNALMTR